MFADLKILELASVLAGPGVGQFFAELGATVIKVENPETGGDVTRSWKGSGEITDDRSAYFCAVNWGKKSIAINLESVEGKSILYKLVEQCDIVIVSYKPGDSVRLGVDYETLKQWNPKLIYGQITGYGSSDPRVGYDAVIQAEAGFMFMNGEPGGASLKMPVALIDVLAGHHLKEGILLALLKRERTGNGDFIEVSLIQAAIASLANQATNWLVAGKIPEKQGSAHPNIAPYGDVFTTADKHEILLAVGSDKQFAALCRVLQVSEIAQDVKFKTNGVRVNNRALLKALLQDRIAKYTADTLIQQLDKAKVPIGRIRNLQEVFETPQAREIMFSSKAISGVKTYVGNPNAQMHSHFLPPPHFGEHTAEILQQSLNITPEAIQILISTGCVAAFRPFPAG